MSHDHKFNQFKGVLKVNSANQGMVGGGMNEPNTLLLNFNLKYYIIYS